MLAAFCVTRNGLQAARLQRRRALEERYKAAEETKFLQQRELEESQKAAKVCSSTSEHCMQPSFFLTYKRGIHYEALFLILMSSPAHSSQKRQRNEENACKRRSKWSKISNVVSSSGSSRSRLPFHAIGASKATTDVGPTTDVEPTPCAHGVGSTSVVALFLTKASDTGHSWSSAWYWPRCIELKLCW